VPVSVLWFRRDLRTRDHPALLAAAAASDVLPLFVLDPTLLDPAGAPRVAYLYRALRALRALRAATKDRLVLRAENPATAVQRVAAEAGAEAVHVSDDFGPYGARRDRAVRTALAAAGRR